MPIPFKQHQNTPGCNTDIDKKSRNLMILLLKVKIWLCHTVPPTMLQVMWSARLNNGQSQSTKKLICQNPFRSTRVSSSNQVRKMVWSFFAGPVNSSLAHAWNLFCYIDKQNIDMLTFQTEI